MDGDSLFSEDLRSVRPMRTSAASARVAPSEIFEPRRVRTPEGSELGTASRAMRTSQMSEPELKQVEMRQAPSRSSLGRQAERPAIVRGGDNSARGGDEGDASTEKRGESNVAAWAVVGAMWVVIVLVASIVSGVLSKLTGKDAAKTPSGQPYYNIVKPTIAPAPVVFSVLWSALLVLFALGGALMIAPLFDSVRVRDRATLVRTSVGILLALVVFGLVVSWMPVFATQQNPLGASRITMALLVLYVPLLFVAARESWAAAAMMAPLLGWLVVGLVMNNESAQRWSAYKAQLLAQQARQGVGLVQQSAHVGV